MRRFLSRESDWWMNSAEDTPSCQWVCGQASFGSAEFNLCTAYTCFCHLFGHLSLSPISPPSSSLTTHSHQVPHGSGSILATNIPGYGLFAHAGALARHLKPLLFPTSGQSHCSSRPVSASTPSTIPSGPARVQAFFIKKQTPCTCVH